jgi:hypothetical protein
MPEKSKPPIKNIGASVKARLLNRSKQRRESFQLVLTDYVRERLLYRLSQTSPSGPLYPERRDAAHKVV